jgi:hypothetical protein
MLQVLSPPAREYLHQKIHTSTLKLAKVEVSEMVEGFSDCIWEGYNYEKTS